MRVRHADEADALVDLADITEIELVILKRMREVTMGEHRSLSHGSGFDFVGLREWQAGDRMASIDWAHSTLTNFSPLMVRDFEQPSSANVVAIADQSLSTRCGLGGQSIGRIVARAIATIGLSAVFFQDPFGLVMFDGGFERLSAVRARTGKGHIVHCLDAYQRASGLQELRRSGSISSTLGGYLRNRALLPVISDFLFDDVRDVLRELSMLNGAHDVFIIVVDAAFAFELPALSSGWLDTVDVETGRATTLSRRAAGQLSDRARAWQDNVLAMAKDVDLDSVRISLDDATSDVALSEFVIERRLRKTRA